MQTPKPPHNLSLYDAMDELMATTQELARHAGLDEGESDAATEFEMTDDSEGEAEELEIPDPDASTEPTMEELQKEAENEYGSGSEDEEELRTSPLPPATTVKVNDKLKSVLAGVHNLRKTDFESMTRKLMF